MAEKLYGFNREHSRILKRMARTAGLAPRTGASVKYPQPLADELAVYLGKTDAQITKGNSGNVSRYSVAADGTENELTDITDSVKNRWATVGANKWVLYTRVQNKFYILTAECPLT